MSSSTPPQDEHIRPPFLPTGVFPGKRSSVPHPHAEDVINATAQHVFPERPAPRQGEGADKDVRRDGVISESEDDAEREEEPIIGGTPLEDIKTPMLERGSFINSRSGGESTIPRIEVPTKAPEEEEAGAAVVPTKAGNAARPGLSAMRDTGSVSRSFQHTLSSRKFATFFYGCFDHDHHGDLPGLPLRSAYALIMPPLTCLDIGKLC